MADRKRKIPKDITRRGPKKPPKAKAPAPKAPPKRGRPVRSGPMVRVKKDKDGNWVRQPVPKPQGGPPGMWHPTDGPYRPFGKPKGRRKKPTPK